jgi:hypothetical protein
MLEYVLIFVFGMMTAYMFSSVMALGHSVLLLKETQKNCAVLFLVSEQGLQETLTLKYLAMKEANRSEQNIVAQRHIDQTNIDSIRKTIMRNFQRVYPDKYTNVLEYTTWEEMQSYVNRVTNEEKGI